MKRIVHVLRSPIFKPNENAFIAPLYRHRTHLNHHGLKIRFFKTLGDPILDCDTLCLSSKYFITWWKNGPDEIIQFLERARKRVNQLIWFDLSDSTGTTHFHVLPYVDKYLKNQLLKNKLEYQKHYYGMRVTTDFYHQTFQIDDHLPHSAHLNTPPTTSDLDKLQVGWNSGLCYYGLYRPYLQHFVWRIGPLHRFLKPRFYSADRKRTLSFTGRIGTQYHRNTVRIPRQMIKDRLSHRLALDKISPRQYFQEMRTSTACLSPFGMGEISLRDFEITLCGAAMIKQNMDHCETWPNLWIRHQTYLDFSWDLSDLEEKIDYAKTHPQQMNAFAKRTQLIYADALKQFVPHFIELLQ